MLENLVFSVSLFVFDEFLLLYPLIIVLPGLWSFYIFTTIWGFRNCCQFNYEHLIQCSLIKPSRNVAGILEGYNVQFLSRLF